MKISDQCTASVGKQPYMDCWFMTMYSLEQANIDVDHREAFLANACVMGVMTIESLLNHLCEFYLPNDVFECVDSEISTLKRFKKAIKFLAGQNNEFSGSKPHDPSWNCKINKVELDDFFKNSNWSKVVELNRIRNKIVHRKVEDKISVVQNDEQIFERDIRDEWKYDSSEIPGLINELEKFLKKLKKIFTKSITDNIEERLISQFNFLDN